MSCKCDNPLWKILIKKTEYSNSQWFHFFDDINNIIKDVIDNYDVIDNDRLSEIYNTDIDEYVSKLGYKDKCNILMNYGVDEAISLLYDYLSPHSSLDCASLDSLVYRILESYILLVDMKDINYIRGVEEEVVETAKVVETAEERAERLFKEDEEIQRKRREEEEKNGLVERQQRRQKCYEKHQLFIQLMYVGDEEKRKGKQYRAWLQNMLKRTSEKVFENEEAEYKWIGKYGRGMFNDKIRTTFNKKDTEVINEIANEYGAFDY